MDIDEDIFDFLPSVLRKYIIYYCRIYSSVKNFTDFLLTGGRDPVLYEVSGKNILSSLHLNETIFKGISFSNCWTTFSKILLLIDFNLFNVEMSLPESAPENDTLNISFNAYYSYKKKIKEQYLFLRINNGLAVLGKVDKQLMVKAYLS